MSSLWLDSAYHSAQVPLSTHSAYMTIRGPPRTSPKQPIVLIQCGAADCSSSFVATTRLIANFARVITYDRAGLGKSSNAHEPPNAANRAKQLHELLEKVDVKPPFVLVGHSLGGLLIPYYLTTFRPGDIAGVVFIDSPCTSAFKARMLTPSLLGCLDPRTPEGERKYEEVIGIDQFKDVLTDAERAEIAADRATSSGVREELQMAMQIGKQADDLSPVLYEKQVLGQHRMSVLWGGILGDFQRVLRYAEVHGHGTEDERQEMKEFLADWGKTENVKQRERLQLAMGGYGRLVQVTDGATHELQLTRPDIIAQEVRWVLALDA